MPGPRQILPANPSTIAATQAADLGVGYLWSAHDWKPFCRRGSRCGMTQVDGDAAICGASIGWPGAAATRSSQFPAIARQWRDGARYVSSVLWENLADPIISGREELRFNKLYCEIPVRGCTTADIPFAAAGSGTP
jgi:hypothetical protein